MTLLLWGGALLRDGIDDWIAATDLPPLLAETSVEVRDRNGNLLRAYTVADGLWRLGARPDAVDPRYVEMLIAYEDRRFCSHSGVDPIAMGRAVLQAVRNGRVVSGGSTLTMQVARLMEDGTTGRWAGKLRQVRVALALERRLTKPEILSLYLTHAPYGGNLEGIRAATLSWFGKEPGRLTPAQAALLVALPQSPETRRPDVSREVADMARSRVLQRAQAAGILSAGDVAAAVTEPVPVARRAFPALAAHMADRVRDDRPDAGVHSLTLDGDLQQVLENLATQSLRGKQERLSIAMVVADHKTGEILASVGSQGYHGGDLRQGFVDMTRAPRSPGSTLKPLVYGLSFDLGLVHPETLILDAPVNFGSYAPQNFDGRFRGEIRVADALRESLNIPVVLLTEEIGPARLMGALRAAGTSPTVAGGTAGLAVSLGGLGMTLEELVTLYAMLGNKGQSVDLHWRLGAASGDGKRVLNRAAAWQVGHVLAQLAPPPGAADLRLSYKTGTSYGHRDAWAIGYDGRHVAGVWIGRPDGTPVPGAFGGELAAPVLFDVFQRLKPTLDPLGPPPPETLLVPTARLPHPLQKFRGRAGVFARALDAVEVTFPPDGAEIERSAGGVTLKLRNGRAPFAVLANGVPVMTNFHRREVTLSGLGRGASVLTVIDANGQSARSRIWLD
nr:penicillin-binding protein 1C [Shimia biformata]